MAINQTTIPSKVDEMFGRKPEAEKEKLRTYRNYGFDPLLNRGMKPSQELTEDIASSQIKSLSGSTIASGQSSSANQKTTLDWDNNELRFSDGARTRVQAGNLDKTGNYGIRIKDRSGVVRFEVSDTTTFSSVVGNVAVVSADESSGDFNDIQVAVDYIFNSTSSAGTVFIKNGAYSLTKNIYVPSEINIVGESETNTIITFTGNYGFKCGYSITGVSGASTDNQFQTISIFGNSLGNAIESTTFSRLVVKNITLDSHVVDIRATTGDLSLSIVENCTDFNSNTTTFIQVQDDIDSCRINNNDIYTSGITFSTGDDMLYSRIVGNVLSSDGNNIIITGVVSGTGEIFSSQILNNELSDFGNTSVAISTESLDTTQVFGNSFPSVDGGIAITNTVSSTSCYHSSISENFISANSDDAIYIGDLYWSKINNNTIETSTSGTNGIICAGGWESQIIGNNCDNGSSTYGTGIGLTDSDRLTVTSNICTDYLQGFIIDNTSDRPTIAGNIFTNNGTNFTNNATNSQVAANVIT